MQRRFSARQKLCKEFKMKKMRFVILLKFRYSPTVKGILTTKSVVSYKIPCHLIPRNPIHMSKSLFIAEMARRVYFLFIYKLDITLIHLHFVCRTPVRYIFVLYTHLATAILIPTAEEGLCSYICIGRQYLGFFC